MSGSNAEDPNLLDPDEAAEEIPNGDGGDVPMDSDSDGDDPLELTLANDAKAYFDKHGDSIFAIAAHPSDPSIFITGGGDDTAYIWTPDHVPSDPDEASIIPREAKQLARLSGHGDSVSAAAFLLGGAYAVTGGLDGKIQLYAAADGWKLVDEAQEVQEVVWIAERPAVENSFALGASDGSVWVYSVNDEKKLQIQHALYLHTGSCTAGAWTRGGELLATVSDDGSLYVWDVDDSGRAVVALTAADQRFAVDGGFFSLAVSPSGAVAAVGGATGEMKVIGLPSPRAIPAGRRGAGRSQPGGGGSTGGSQAGRILASLHMHTESIESLSFHPTQPLLASACVGGKIVIYDAARGYSVRTTLGEGGGHTDAVVKVEFVNTDGWILTSCGVDGTVRRWDARAGVELGCWRGHLGGNEAEGEGGVLGFVQTRDRIVTAGDEYVFHHSPMRFVFPC